MKILITGGTGFIGTYFVRELMSRGHDLVLLDLYPFDDDVTDIDQSNLNVQIGDIRDHAALEKAMTGCDAVLHLAAAHHDFGISEKTFEDVNVGGAKTICETMDRLGIRNVCFYSSVAIYGEGNPPIDEDSPPLSETPYGKTKYGGEQVFSKWVESSPENRCLVIRPTVTFGAGNFANMFTLISQIDKGMFLPVGDGKNVKSLSYIENIVDATITMWLENETAKTGFVPYNYVCKPDLSSGEISRIVYRALGKGTPKLRVPYFLARALALPFDAVIALTGKNLPISGARIRKMAKAQTQYEATRIRDDGFEQGKTIEQGIEKMVRWYLDEGKEQAKSGHRRRLPPEQPAKQN